MGGGLEVDAGQAAQQDLNPIGEKASGPGQPEQMAVRELGKAGFHLPGRPADNGQEPQLPAGSPSQLVDERDHGVVAGG